MSGRRIWEFSDRYFPDVCGADRRPPRRPFPGSGDRSVARRDEQYGGGWNVPAKIGQDYLSSE